MNPKGITIIFCIISAAAACGLTWLATREAHERYVSPTIGLLPESSRTSPIDINDPMTWEAAVTRLQDQTSNVTRALLDAAKDEGRDPEQRRKAVFLLGRVKTEESIRLLVDNIGLRVRMDTVDGEDDALKETPCLYALIMGGDWGVAQVVLKALDEPKSKLELQYLGSVLDACLGRDVGQAIVNKEFQRATGGPTMARARNLETIKEYLLQ